MFPDPEQTPLVLRFDRVSKGFPGVQALSDVSFGVRGGSVHALCGENGAGKSTLLKILSGVYRPDAGAVVLGGKPRVFTSPTEALRAGIAVIYQELHLVPEMTVAENIYLGHLPSLLGWVDRGRLIANTLGQMRAAGVEIDPKAKVGTLPLALRQMVEIAKALSRDARVLAFDEPTSSLSAREVETLFALIAELKRQGRAILYVSHRMDEIFHLCDAGTVLRDGKHVETFHTLSATTPGTLVARMVGRELSDIFGYREREHGPPALEVTDLTGPGLTAPASLTVRQGEIVGVFGLVGAGRTELLRAIYGATGTADGAVTVQGNGDSFRAPSEAIRAGVVLCPEDRKKEGIVPVRSVQENINLSARRRHAFAGFALNEKWERTNAGKQVQALRIRTPSLAQPIGLLSGGNQQKAILARWLSEDVKVLLLDEPTRGVDVGAKREIYDIIYAQAEAGVGVLLVSSEIPEVLGVCDRILVMREGRIVAGLTRAEATPEKCLRQALPVATDVPAEAVVEKSGASSPGAAG
jgi:L-arabinose transport system ATP-binding protein